MNLQLTEQIIRHIYKNLGVILPNASHRMYSIMKPEYELAHTLKFDDGQENKIWGVDLKAPNGNISILLADCATDPVPEYAAYISVDGAETSYGCYLSYKEYDTSESADYYPMIACKINNTENTWAECNVLLQASFLVGMEKMKELDAEITRSNNEKGYNSLIEFIKFYQESTEMQ